jgi:flagellar biosynthesis protein FlhG
MPSSPSNDAQHAVIITVTSGKGGVGKTSFAVNLATELAVRGHRSVLIDADLGLANAHILCGSTAQKSFDLFLDGKAKLADIVQTGPAGMKLISGGSGIAEMANLDAAGRARITDAILRLRPHCDVIVIDTGAGVAHSVTDFVMIADQTIVVTTSNFAAIADAYGIIKVSVQAGSTAPMHLVVNRVRSPEEADQVFKKIRGCTERFLDFNLEWLGLLPEDNATNNAVQKRVPFVISFPDSVATRYMKRMVASVERMLPTSAAPA